MRLQEGLETKKLWHRILYDKVVLAEKHTWAFSAKIAAEDEAQRRKDFRQAKKNEATKHKQRVDALKAEAEARHKAEEERRQRELAKEKDLLLGVPGGRAGGGAVSDAEGDSDGDSANSDAGELSDIPAADDTVTADQQF